MCVRVSVTRLLCECACDPTSAAGQSHFVCAVPDAEPLALAGHHAQTADVVAVALVRSAGGKIGAGL